MTIKTNRIKLLGVPVDLVDMTSALDHVRDMFSGHSNNIIIAVNPEKVIAAQADPQLLKIIENAALIIPDGIGVVIASRMLGKGRMERVPGADLMPNLCGLASSLGKSVFLYGAAPEVIPKAAKLLQEKYPDLAIAGFQHGYVSDDNMDELIETINKSGASILFVGLGSPRQEIWMDRYRDRLTVKVCQGVGGTFDAICGYPKRAPAMIQKMNLEWLYRLVTQPQRLRRQQALPRFVFQVLRNSISSK